MNVWGISEGAIYQKGTWSAYEKLEMDVLVAGRKLTDKPYSKFCFVDPNGFPKGLESVVRSIMFHNAASRVGELDDVLEEGVLRWLPSMKIVLATFAV